jgi:hypothetical protein
MSRVVTAAAVALLIVFAPIAGAQMKAGGMLTSEANTVLTLISVDPFSHVAVLRSRDGTSLVVEMPTEAQKMQHAKPGALFRMHFVESLGFEIERGGLVGTFENQVAELAPPGARPAIEVVTTRRIAFVVQSIDTGGRQMTLRDAQSKVSTFTYTGLLQNVDEIAVGDTFSLIHVETLTLEMMPEQIQTSR